jgi:hypothetical protein
LATTPQEDGRRFEVEWTSRIGAHSVPGSGNKWYAKMDGSGGGIRWSCKHTRNKSYRLTQDDLVEVFEAVEGSGGDGSMPAMALRIGSERFDLVVLRADDFISLVTEKVEFIRESKGEQKRRRAKQSILFRDE